MDSRCAHQFSRFMYVKILPCFQHVWIKPSGIRPEKVGQISNTVNIEIDILDSIVLTKPLFSTIRAIRVDSWLILSFKICYTITMNSALFWTQLSERSPAQVARYSGASIQPDGSYHLQVLDNVYSIDCSGHTIIPLCEEMKAKTDPHSTIAIINYLTNAKEVEPINEWVSPRSFSGGIEFFTGQHAVPVDRLLTRYGTDKESFKTACEELGGLPIEYADAAYSFFFFPRLPIAVLLWTAVNDSPARASILVDWTADQHLALDGLLGVMSVMQTRLAQEN